MKANQFSESISPMDLERLTAGSVWKDADGEHGFILAITNRKVPKQVRDRFPLSVVYTSACDSEGVFTIRVADFLKTMTFVSEGYTTAGFVQSMLSALKAHKELGVSPQTVTVAVDSTELPGDQEVDADSPVQILFTNNVPEATSQVVNSRLTSFVEKPYDNTLELTFEGLQIDELTAVFQHLVHVDTEHKVYSAEQMQLVGVTQAYIRQGVGYQDLTAVTLALLGSEPEPLDETAVNEALKAELDAAGVPREAQTEQPQAAVQA